jgi:hypothetical protein
MSQRHAAVHRATAQSTQATKGKAPAPKKPKEPNK